MRLLVVAGHGAGDPGAVGNGFSEAERVRVLANRMKALGGNSVILGDTSQDWYRSGLFNSVKTSTFDAAIELHMDSGVPSACGGHVIIQSGFCADAYDNNLANFLKGYFPGRAEIIKGRDDLANPGICVRRGINYRLAEVCFVSNQADLTKFNNNLDSVAKGILGAFGIGTSSNTTSTPSPAPTPKPSTPGKKSITEVAKEVIAGKYGNGDARKVNVEKAGYNYASVQAEVNRQLGFSSSAPAKKSIDTIANEVIAGVWGNGADRQNRLQAAGYNYNEVQRVVNQKLGY